MTKYLITYDLKTPGKNYSGLYEAIKGLGAWWHYLDSTWIIKSQTLDSTQIFNRLQPHIDNNDNILVVEIIPTHSQGLLPPEAWNWINSLV